MEDNSPSFNLLPIFLADDSQSTRNIVCSFVTCLDFMRSNIASSVVVSDISETKERHLFQYSRVKYMGAAPVGGRVASVRGLQEPLRQLLERIDGSVRAELEVSRRGLTFRASDTTERNNPFRRIAVWSALRLRSKATPSGELHHAFLPLVGDHEQSQAGEEKHADLYRTMRDHYPPIFAVVMRRPGAARLLECHAFGCETEEDAVAAAATLYRALVADLDANRRRPRHANGVGCMSLTSVASSVREPSPSSKFGIRMNVLQSEAVRCIPQHPVRPPRTKKTSVSSSVTEDEVTEKSPELQKAPRRKKKNSDVKAEDILEARGRRREAVPKEKANSTTQSVTSIQKNFDSRVSKKEERENIKNKTLKRSQSDVDVDRGDLMTRVELPRRGSFLKPASARRPNSVKGGTPLGFTELFDEFRNQEGLTSVDDILAAIIDPEGMSFNDLKPLYKEFLLKLAATLTQDELYQRSASIMRRRRRPQRRRSSRRTCLLGRAIKRSVSRLKGGPTEFTSVIFPARRLNDSFGSSSSCDARNNHRNRMLANKMGKRRSSWRANKHGSHYDRSGRRLNRSAGAAANRSSSGYVSCSECSYDSESCTCVSADKCYCSLSRRIPTELHVPPNTVVCACDTDSCSESNKCYCARQPNRPTILEQLRQRGIVPSESTLSRAGSPDRVTKTGRCRTPFQGLDVPKKQSSSSYGSSNNLALDYDLFNPGRKSQQSSDSEKVLVVSARDTQGRLVYVGGADRDKKCLSHCSSRSGAHHEALSIKKSAEIAAIFGADWNRISRRASNASSVKSSISLEAGLGYLP
ncbi:hypothetical protein WN51_05110 [Melipona quadrifasciata]|uniref:PID domain-containing protein n=1 Tax=Melipona quadrifasciata TaxID=166423 RepID=A0A0M8ZTB4_9HYME|nr:hypothetical protein WN51_05110 [Melipona quadrifasciata]